MPLHETDQERAFARVLWLLRNYLSDLVVIGGWVPYLYKRYGGDPWVGRQSRTAEVDVLTMPPLPMRAGISLEQALLAAGLAPTRETGPAAVWEAASDSGEQIEFLTPLSGTALQRGSTVGISGHGRVGAIMLWGLELLAQHTATLTVPVGEFEGRLHELTVRVPRLGAYIVNKCVVALARTAHLTGPNPKQAKDVVYIHDVMAAGSAIRQRVRDDIHSLWTTGGKTSLERQTIRKATINVGLLLTGSMGIVAQAGEELGTRDGLNRMEAAARIRGQLADLLEILRETQKRRKGHARGTSRP